MMRIAILGGTGAMGTGLALRLSKSNEVRIGSRAASKAMAAAAKIPGAMGSVNFDAAAWCEAAVVAMPFGAIGSLKELAGPLSGKLVVSMVNPIKMKGDLLSYASEGRSAAEQIARDLPKSAVATAFNNIPVSFLRRATKPEADVLIAADSRETFDLASRIVMDVPGLRPLYIGPLSEAESVERLTVMVLNAARLRGGPNLSVRFVS